MKRFRMRNSILPLLALASMLPGSSLPAWAGLTYTCDPSIDAAQAGTCAYLNNTIAGLYTSTFTNINASIYIRYGNTGLGESDYLLTQVSYSSYLSALNANAQASGNAVQAAAVKALNSVDTQLYGNSDVEIPGALSAALGFGPQFGISADGMTLCIPAGAATCYNGIVTITNEPGILYFRTGTEGPNQYDFYSTAEHETDEVLGTASCIDTTGPALVDDCGPNMPSSVDLFRYQSAGDLALISTRPGAYFSYDGGQTNGANGKVYNTLDNGDDYADFVSSKPCQAAQSIQDAEGCPGQDHGLDITNDGGAEINILNAVGYTLSAPPAKPPTITPNGVVPIFSTSTLIESGSWISVFGTNFAGTTTVWNGNFPTTLGGVTVAIDGKPAYIWFVGPTQINVQVPDDSNTGSVNVSVTNGSGTATSTATLSQFSPTFSLLDATHPAGVIPTPNGTGAYGNGTYDLLGPSGAFSYNTRPVKKGETVELFATGFGPTTPAVPAGQVYNGPAAPTGNQITVTVGGVSQVLTGYEIEAGLYQINVTIPQNVASGDITLEATVGGLQTPATVRITVQ